MHDLSPGAALAGGCLIGLGAAALLLSTGRLAGISNIVGGLVRPAPGDSSWRWAFLIGLLLAGVAAATVAPQQLGASPASPLQLAVAGLLVGVGTRVGNGCTSGHGVCGVSRLSPRSLVATLVFIAAAIATVAVLHWLGSPP